MATLHVRNVPEPLYELLRSCAEREGRSIGAQAVELLQSALLRHEPLKHDVVSKAIRRRRSPFLKRFAEAGKDIAVRAEERARELGAAEVSPAHVLLAMFEDDVLRESLEAGGLTEEGVLARAPRGDESPANIPFSTESKQMLERALRTSIAARQTEVNPAHVMFAAHEFAGFRFQRGDQDDDYRAVDLEGDADAWTARLNEIAREGWELVHVHGARAIFRRAA